MTENERLNIELQSMISAANYYKMQYETAKSEAIKEFAKRLKSKVNDLEFRTKTNRKTVPTKFCDDNANWVMHECVPEEIDNLVKEMTVENEK